MSNLYKYYEIQILSCLILYLVFSTSSYASKYIDANNLDEAMVMAASEIQVVDQTAKLCGQEFHKLKDGFDKINFMWILQNQSEIHAVMSYMDNITDDQKNKLFSARAISVKISMKPINLLSNDLLNSYCAQFVEKVKSKERDLKHRTPKLSNYLTDYLGSHPLPSDFLSQWTIRQSCILGGLKKNGNYQFFDNYCTCYSNVLMTHLNKKEQAELYKSVKVDRKAAESSPLMLRIKPYIEECVNNAK